MKHNQYDNKTFFDQYALMARSQYGLQAAGEWPTLKNLMPEIKGKRILDLGCGYGWHCKWLIEQGASEVIGVDSSSLMIEKAESINSDKNIKYLVQDISKLDVTGTFDLILSSLVLHYIEDYPQLIESLKPRLNQNGTILFSVEHPIFTAEGSQTWVVDKDGKTLHWPVDHYYDESWRTSTFLGESVMKYHRTMSQYINTLITAGFTIDALTEVIPPQEWLQEAEENLNELRRPMMLIIKAHI